MYMKLHIGNMSILTLKEDRKPFAMINWHLVDVIVSRDEMKYMNTKITGAEFNGSFFEYEGNKIRERKMLGSLDERDSYCLENVPDDRIIPEIAEYLKQYAQKIAQGHMLKEVAQFMKAPTKKKVRPIIVEVALEPNGNMNVKVAVNQLRTYLATSAFLTLQEFVMVDDSIIPPIPRTSNPFL